MLQLLPLSGQARNRGRARHRRRISIQVAKPSILNTYPFFLSDLDLIWSLPTTFSKIWKVSTGQYQQPRDLFIDKRQELTSLEV